MNKSTKKHVKPESLNEKLLRLKWSLLIGLAFLLAIAVRAGYQLGAQSALSKNQISPTTVTETSDKSATKKNPTGTAVEDIEESSIPEATLVPQATNTPALPRIQTYAAGDKMVYKNNVRGFSFQYPTYFVINSSSSESWISFLQKQDNMMAQRMLVQVEDSNQELDSYADAKGYQSYGDKESNSISGHNALLFVKNQSQKDVCNFDDDTKMKRVKLALIKGNGYIMTFLPNDSCETFKSDWFSSIPQSTEFFK